jgi:hypothetical protein
MDVASTRFTSNRQETDAPVIYHYTDPRGLIGILSDDQLWATDIRYLNDSSELLHAEALQRQMLEELIAEGPSGSLQQRLAAWAWDRRRGGGTDKTFVICFSEKDDLLTQWKTYGSWGAGFSIGFDRARLEASLSSLAPRSTAGLPGLGRFEDYTEAQVARVQYSEEEQRLELRRVFAQYSTLLSPKSSDFKFDMCATAIADNVALSASKFKHSSFSAEAEWRIIVTWNSLMSDLDDLCFRPSGRTVIPYVKTQRLPVGKLPVVSITIGPTLDRALSYESVSTLLRSKGYYKDRQVEIKTSSIPLVRMD